MMDEQSISVLRNLKLTDIHRKHEDVAFTFAADDGTGYILMTYTFFRITDGDRILVTETDVFLKDGFDDDLDGFSWDETGANAFDHWLSCSLPELVGQSVVSAELSKYNDLILRFSDGVVLTLYPEYTGDGEYWEIFPVPDK
jgi:hypothetical protein